MTKKKNLTAFMIAIIVMLFSLPANAQGTVGYAQYDTNSKTLTFYGGEMPTTGAYELNTDSNKPGWNRDDDRVVASSCTKVVFDASFNDVRPNSCYFWFQGFSNLSIIEGIKYLNTDSVKYMQAMFYGCSGLTSLNLSNFNTANVEYMDNMFDGCSGLTSLDLSSFNTDNVTKMSQMFAACSGLTTIYVSDDFKIGNVTDDGYYMFYDCTILKGDTSYKPEYTDKYMANYNTGYFKTYYELGGNKVELFGKQLTTNSLNLIGDKDFVAHAPFKANEATYSRDLSTSNSTWFSLCLPFAYTPGNNFTA